jgi:hypothetical protein
MDGHLILWPLLYGLLQSHVQKLRLYLLLKGAADPEGSGISVVI